MQKENFDVDKFFGSEGSTEFKPRYAKSKCPHSLEKNMLNLWPKQGNVIRKATVCLSVWMMVLSNWFTVTEKHMKQWSRWTEQNGLCTAEEKGYKMIVCKSKNISSESTVHGHSFSASLMTAHKTVVLGKC